jgi:hypothetical protein
LDAGVITVEINTSMILLKKYPCREFDARVGYFANQFGVLRRVSKVRPKCLQLDGG